MVRAYVWVGFAAASLFGCSTESIKVNASKDASAATGGAANRDAAREASPAPCTPDVPDACPMPKPGYVADVVPILETKCNGCHDGHDGGPWPLTNHADVEHWTAAILSTLKGCTMPPPTSPMPLTEAERSTLIAWLVCGAPNN